MRNSEIILTFKNGLLSFICPVQDNMYNIFDPIGLKVLTYLRLGFSNLSEHSFQYNFQDCMNPLCSCSLEIENALHYCIAIIFTICIDLMNNVKSLTDNFEFLSDNDKLYGDSR